MPKVTIICQQCAQPFQWYDHPSNRAWKKGKYCSFACRCLAQTLPEGVQKANRQAARLKNIERLRDYDRLRNKTPERKAHARRMYAKHRTQRLESQRQRRQNNPEQYRRKDKTYQQTHPDQVRARNHRRKARLRGASRSDLTAAQWQEIQDAQGHRCYYCGKRYKGRLTQDHIIPLSKGGEHTLHNVIGACGVCNSRKGTKAPPKPVQPLLLTIAPKKSKH